MVANGAEVGDRMAFTVTGTRAELEALAKGGEVVVAVQAPALKSQPPARATG
jgi:hypothetical protein